jgi:hypothetical protein
MRRWMLAGILCALAACGGGDDGDGDADIKSGGEVFDENAVHEFQLTMAPGDWEALVANPGQDERVYYRATLSWRGETWPDVGVRASGQNSAIPGNPKPSIVLGFEEFAPGRHFHGLPSLKLNWLLDDPAFMRQRLTFGIHRQRGLAAPREAHGRLLVNGSYKGLYGVTERITRSFVKKRFGEPVNQVYKKGRTGSDFVWRGESHPYVPVEFEPKAETVPAGEAEVRDLYRTLNAGTYEEIDRVFDVDVFLNVLAIEIICGEDDGYRSGPDEQGNIWSSNFYLYKNPRNGKFTMIVWDRGEDYWRPPQEPITHTFERRVLTRRLIVERPENLARLRQILREILSGPSEVNHMVSRLEHLRSLLAPYVAQEPPNPKRNPPSVQTWGFEVNDLRDQYIRERIANLQLQLQ